MIKIISAKETSEYLAALQLRNLIADAWPMVADVDNTEDWIYIVAGAKCYGQRVVDIDLVVLVRLNNLGKVPENVLTNTPLYIRSLCLTIELKEHQPEKVRFEGNQAQVRYYESGWKSVTEQSHQQQVSLRNFIKNNEINSPFVTNLIWFLNLPNACLPGVSNNFVGQEATWSSFLEKVILLKKPAPRASHQFDGMEINAFSRLKHEEVKKLCELLTKEIEPSALDRKKIEMLSQRQTVEKSDKLYIQKLGKQLLIFRGKAGTGKTVHLLTFARDLYAKENARVLLLTYNKALVADIKRLLAIMGVPDTWADRSIEVKTLHSFLWHLTFYVDRQHARANDFIKQFEHHRKALLLDLERCRQNNIDLRESLVQRAYELFAWDFILIDEAQDWHEEERKILFLLYDYRRFIVADSADQLVRSDKPTDWRVGISTKDAQIVTLRKVLRSKSGLVDFASLFASKFNLLWETEKEGILHGGQIIVIVGNYIQDQSLHDSLVQRCIDNGNQPLDMLFCVPPSLVKKDPKQPDCNRSYVSDRFQKWGYET